MNKKLFSFIVLFLLIANLCPAQSIKADSFGLTATPKCGFILLKWNPVPDALRYYVYRGPGKGLEYTVPLTDFPISETEYKDSIDLEVGKTFCYYIKAVNADDREFLQSEEACAAYTCQEETPPPPELTEDDCKMVLKYQVDNPYYYKNDIQKGPMDAKPIIFENRFLLVVRSLAEETGAEVFWDASTRTVTIKTLDGTVLEFQIGNPIAKINGVSTQIDQNNQKVVPIIDEGRTKLPLRLISYNLGATGLTDIVWQSETKTAVLTFKDPNCKWVCGCFRPIPATVPMYGFFENCNTEKPLTTKISRDLQDNILTLTLTEYIQKYPNQEKWCADVRIDEAGNITAWRARPDKYPNCCEETPTPPRPPNPSKPINILSGPTVTDIKQTSANVEWETDQDSDSVVFYDSQINSFEKKESANPLVKKHKINLSGLTSNTVYQFYVLSTDKMGNIVKSNEAFFKTLPNRLTIKPNFRFKLPDSVNGVIRISPEITGMGGYRFFRLNVDDTPTSTNYSPPFDFHMDTALYKNGSHKIGISGVDLEGAKIELSQTININNLLRVLDKGPSVKIMSPDDNTDFDKSTQLISIEAEINHPQNYDIKRVEVLIDDKLTETLFSRVKGKNYANKEDLPKKIKVSVSISELSPGKHTLTVKAKDSFDVYGSASISFTSHLPIWKKPSLSVYYSTSITASVGTNYRINFNVANNGTWHAKDITLKITQNFMPGFLMTNFSETAAVTLTDDKKQVAELKRSFLDYQSPNKVWTFSFDLVPVMVESLNWNDYDIINKVEYKFTWDENPIVPVWNTKNISTDAAVDIAWMAHNADYLIMTNYTNLLSNNPGKKPQIYELLSKMARLASLKKGVLGLLSTGTLSADSVKSKINSWSGYLKSGYSSNGYLLLVGETDIIPSYTRTYWWNEEDINHHIVNTAHDCRTTDFPYANTSGAEIGPELCIGRIIGNSVEKLIKPIKASIDVKLGTAEFYRNHNVHSNAYTLSGTGDGEDKFWESAQNNGIKIQEEFHSVAEGRSKWMLESSIKPYDSIKDRASTLSVLFYRDHGGRDCWCDGVVVATSAAGPVSVSGLNFGNYRPFVFACCCDSGYYQAIYGMADAFMEKASVYIGSTEGSGRNSNNYYSMQFFIHWINHPEKPLGLAWKETRVDAIGDVWWSAEYQFFGDPKFGSVP